VTRRTTICCSASALAAATLLVAHVPEPIALVPVRPVWTLALNSHLTLAPTYDAARAFFPIENDRIAAYQLVSGERVWLEESKPVLPAVSVDGLLVVPEAEAIVALHAENGREAWRVAIDDPLAAPAAAVPGFVVASDKAGAVTARRVADGSVLWRRELGSAGRAPASLHADRMYVPVEDGRIVALAADTGEIVWERKIGGRPGAILALDERLFVGSTDNFFYCLMTKDGRIDWRWRTGADIVGAAVADDSTVYFASLDNVLRALAQKSGGQRWMRALPLRPTSGPVLAGTTVVVAGQSPTIRTFNAKDGAPGVDINAGDDVAAPPYVFTQPMTGLPMIAVVTRNIERADSVALSVRSIEPIPTPIGPLPNAVMPSPTPPTPP
jgi:outer membrane protein assembly factor BamB